MITCFQNEGVLLVGLEPATRREPVVSIPSRASDNPQFLSVRVSIVQSAIRSDNRADDLVSQHNLRDTLNGQPGCDLVLLASGNKYDA